MSNIIYVGPFKHHIQNYVELKKAVGYKYDTEASHLKRFDRFTVEKYSQATALTRPDHWRRRYPPNPGIDD